MVYKKIHHHSQSKKSQISLFLDHEMSHASDETWEDEVGNLLEPKNGWRNEVFNNPASMNSIHEQEQRAGGELEMARAEEEEGESI